MARILNLGLNSATTSDWLNATRHMNLTALDPCFRDSYGDLASASTKDLSRPPKKTTRLQVKAK
jgi:hypothetical protein